jgi:hypothetical protein
MKSFTIAAAAIVLAATLGTANAGPEANHAGHITASGQWQMNDIGRNHGVIGGGNLMPKCNPHVSPECARLYPCLLKGLDYCMALRAQRAARRH